MCNGGARNDWETNVAACGISPLLKWPGGKRRLLKYIIPLLPEGYKRYYEPFVGGGALFFRLLPNCATISDTNSDLIDCYIQVRDKPLEVIDALRKMRNSESDYYKIRKSVPKSNTAKAARIIYLTTLSFNGIYRQNLNGKFNVPYGYKTHITLYNPDAILAASKALTNTELICADFASAVGKAEKGDLVYLDPPYTVAHNNNGFVKYNANIFSWDDQKRLATLAMSLKKRGCYVLVSNAYHSSILDLYAEFNMFEINRASVIAAASVHRASIKECVFY